MITCLDDFSSLFTEIGSKYVKGASLLTFLEKTREKCKENCNSREDLVIIGCRIMCFRLFFTK